MGKIVIIMVVIITAIIGTIMVSVNSRSEEVPKMLGNNYQDIGSYALQYAINQVVNENISTNTSVGYSDDPFEVLDGQINSIDYQFVTNTVEYTDDDGEEEDYGYSITGTLNINPSNNESKQFEMLTPQGVIDRDEIHENAPEFSYDGFASVIKVRAKSHGRTLTINGVDIVLHPSTRYTITSDSMHVNLWNDNNSNGKSMGRWWITINANDAIIDLFDVENEDADEDDENILLSVTTTECFITANVTMNVNSKSFSHDSRTKIVNTVTVEGENPANGDSNTGVYTISGNLNINPGNSSQNEFQMETPSGYIDRDEVHANAPEFSYSGIATVVRVRPKAQGKTLNINGTDITLGNTRYTITSNNMTVNLYNDKIKKGKAMGKWWITIDATNASIEPDPYGDGEEEEEGSMTVTETGCELLYWNP